MQQQCWVYHSHSLQFSKTVWLCEFFLSTNAGLAIINVRMKILKLENKQKKKKWKLFEVIKCHLK